MTKEMQILANDLKVYFKGFEVALDNGNIDDAIRYLKDIRRELNNNLDYLQSKKESTAVQELLKKNLQESLDDYKSRIKQIEEELRKK
jgi:DNA repair exonuclease SbcCD ATPase subunit